MRPNAQTEVATVKIQPLELSVLLFREAGGWVAQCLEYDIAAQGSSKVQAYRSLRYVIAGHLVLDQQKGRSPFQGIERAPEWYWEQSRKALNDAFRERPIRCADRQFSLRAFGLEPVAN
jgi:hypothetical protein